MFGWNWPPLPPGTRAIWFPFQDGENYRLSGTHPVDGQSVTGFYGLHSFPDSPAQSGNDPRYGLLQIFETNKPTYKEWSELGDSVYPAGSSLRIGLGNTQHLQPFAPTFGDPWPTISQPFHVFWFGSFDQKDMPMNNKKNAYLWLNEDFPTAGREVSAYFRRSNAQGGYALLATAPGGVVGSPIVANFRDLVSPYFCLIDVLYDGFDTLLRINKQLVAPTGQFAGTLGITSAGLRWNGIQTHTSVTGRSGAMFLIVEGDTFRGRDGPTGPSTLAYENLCNWFATKGMLWPNRLSHWPLPDPPEGPWPT